MLLLQRLWLRDFLFSEQADRALSAHSVHIFNAAVHRRMASRGSKQAVQVARLAHHAAVDIGWFGGHGLVGGDSVLHLPPSQRNDVAEMSRPPGADVSHPAFRSDAASRGAGHSFQGRRVPRWGSPGFDWSEHAWPSVAEASQPLGRIV